MTPGGAPGKAHNPFVGPRAFRQGEQLYGRDREVLDLLDLLIAERIVLLYSPSGAGKTSLINAGLVPSLQEEGFGVLPVARIGLDPDGDHTVATGNRYLASMLLSLERDAPAGSQPRTAALGETSLGAYLEQRGLADGRDHHVLIIDALEELLTLDPTDRAAKERFMAELGDVLRDGRRWALFALREDYLGGLEPFLRYVPTRLATTFRLNLLEAPAARAAMQSPVRSAGVAFLDAAAEKLVDNLRSIRVQRPEGRVEEAGPYVEPVQLQVVCRRLWDRLPADATEISTSDVDAVGDVDRALADYYAEQVATIAAGTRVPERTIREWFDRELITGQGFRAQVLEGPDGDAERQVLRELQDAHLVRAEQRRGATWFELTHDRLVQPIRTDNAAWRERNLTALQRQAVLWDEQHRGEGLLLRGDALQDAERLLRDEPVELSETEGRFLAACRALAGREREAAQRQAWLRWLTVGLAILLVLTLVAAAAALQQRNRVQVASGRASAAARLATSRQLTAESAAALGSDPRTALLLGIAAARVHDDAETRASLANSLIATRYAGTLSGHRLSVNSVAFSKDGRTLATASDDQTVRLWDLSAWARPVQLGQPLTGHHGKVTSVAFSPDRHTLATASTDRTVRLWDIRQRVRPVQLGRPLTGHHDGVYSVAFSPDGRLLATAGHDGAVLLWRMTDPAGPRRLGPPLGGHGGPVWSVAFSPDGRYLATGTDDEAVRLWDVREPEHPDRAGRRLGGHGGPVTSVAFSPDGRLLASGSTDHLVRLWDVRHPADPRGLGQPLTGHTAAVYSVAFSPDGGTLATASYDTTTILWKMTEPARPSQLGRPLTDHAAAVTPVAFSPDGRTLASGGRDGTASLRDLAGHRADPAPVGPPLKGHGGEVASVAFSPDGRTVVSGDADATATLWAVTERPSRDRPPPERARPARLGRPLEGHGGEVASVAFSRDGRYLATGSADRTVMLWDVSDLTDPARVGPALKDHKEAVTSVAFSPDAHLLATGSDDATVTLWDITSPSHPGRVGPALKGHEEAVTSVAFSPDGSLLATGGDDATTAVWNVSDPSQPERVGPALRGQQGVASVAFSPDGHTLASGGDDTTVTLWNVEDATHPAQLGPPLKGHDAAVTSVAFSPDGRTLASGGDDREVLLWDLSNPAQRARIGAPLVGHAESVTSVAFSPDGHSLVSGSEDGTLVLWNLTELNAIRNYPLERACALTGRGLSHDEWTRYVPGLPYEDSCPNRP